jgi:hypothetical protein
LGSCQLSPEAPLASVEFGQARLRIEAWRGEVARGLHGVALQVDRQGLQPSAWTFDLLVFDDLDGDAMPSARERLANRQALGSRSGTIRFPGVRWAGAALRPCLRARFHDGQRLQEVTVPLPVDS